MFTSINGPIRGNAIICYWCKTVPENETHRYGIIDPIEQNGRRYQVRQFVEKPAQGTAPSNLAIMGRYILTPEILHF